MGDAGAQPQFTHRCGLNTLAAEAVTTQQTADLVADICPAEAACRTGWYIKPWICPNSRSSNTSLDICNQTKMKTISIVIAAIGAFSGVAVALLAEGNALGQRSPDTSVVSGGHCPREAD